MSTILVTGANKGLGHETARQLLAAGHTVYVGARDGARGQAAAAELGARFVQIDVTDDASVTAAAKTVAAEGGLDVLVNNAGIEPRAADGGFLPAGDVTGDSMRAVFEANVFGQVRMLHAFLPLLQASPAPAVVNVSSGLALTRELADPESFTHFYPGVEYPASKAAVNMLTVQYAKAFPGIRINAVDPGYTATDLNHNAGTQTVAEGAAVIVRMAQVGPDGPTGGFFEAAGPVDW
ncbi:SDR family NAD(P)-dependent oxidoreductase [Catenulispora yoronensis]|uniref:SDR family NAD(P)-dependent oxidoreductase n=1 Tax=Catenulispora yoronensis TaxID=450799 RepID=A0ABN2UQ58_9ACTN